MTLTQINSGVGLCECGCGATAPIAKVTQRDRGAVKGQPQRFIRGHATKNRLRESDARFLSNGYVMLRIPSHPRASARGYVAEHIVVAQRVLGKPLPSKAEIHHVNRNRQDNRNANLVICEDRAYHSLLHRRLRVREAGGDPDKEALCPRCGLQPLQEFSARGGYCKPCRRTGRVNAKLKLSVEDVVTIRKSTESTSALAVRYGVVWTTIWRIRNDPKTRRSIPFERAAEAEPQPTCVLCEQVVRLVGHDTACSQQLGRELSPAESSAAVRNALARVQRELKR